MTTDAISRRFEADMYGDTLLQACEFIIAIVFGFNEKWYGLFERYFGVSFMSTFAQLSMH